MRLIRLHSLVVAIVLLVPISAFAQEAVISGAVADATGGVLPGVVMRAVNQASGNSFEAVTDGTGAFRISLRVGVYEITAELAGFTTVTRRGLELLVGQQVTMNLQMSPSTIQESVTVTGEAPLIETTSSSMSANLDPRQMRELPVNGRNWQDLIAVVPGARYNSQQRGDSIAAGTGTMQLNLDGQQVTQTISAGDRYGFGQPRFGQDAIAEVEYVSNRFDASQGRSMGVQVNAITRSGTNTMLGTLSGFFRDDKFNAADHVAGDVLPYQNQQLAVTFGGPIRRDRLHFFGDYEYEREPNTSFYNTPVPAFNQTLTEIRTEKKALIRVDGQISPQTHLSIRGSIAHPLTPNESLHGSGNATPNGRITNDQHSRQLQGTVTKVFSSSIVNEMRVGYNAYNWLRNTQTPFNANSFLSNWVPNYEKEFGPVMAPKPLTVNAIVTFRGLSNGGSGQPQNFNQEEFSLRNDFSVLFAAKGQHTLKAGGDVIKTHNWGYVCQGCVGTLDAQGGALPSNVASIFPDLYDVTTWKLDLLAPIVRRFSASIGNNNQDWPRATVASWLQDDWAVTRKLTLNLGVRYDLAHNADANDVEIPPFLAKNRPDDTNNWAPRLGFAYTVTPRTVIRGGAGRFFAERGSSVAFFTLRAAQQVNVVINNDGRPDFPSNPYNGKAPTTYADAYRYVVQNNQQIGLSGLVGTRAITPFSYQTSIGVQHQLLPTTGIQADYVFSGIRDDAVAKNINLSYNPATGVNYPNTDRAHLPYPQFSTVSLEFPDGYSNYHALQTAITRRLSNNWQASATYTLAYFYDGYKNPAPGVPNLAPDLGAQYSHGVSDQRHRAVFNGIWQMKHGFQLSGVYFFGSGERFANICGCGLRLGAGNDTLMPDGSFIARNSFVGKPVHRADVRLLKSVPLGARRRVDGMIDLFNAFNHANYGSYILEKSNANFGTPTQNPALNYQARMMQLGFRITF